MGLFIPGPCSSTCRIRMCLKQFVRSLRDVVFVAIYGSLKFLTRRQTPDGM
jgi:hypothetical protein